MNAFSPILAAIAAGLWLPWAALAATNAATRTGSAWLQTGRRDTRVHDPSTIVRCKDDYWVFATGSGILSRRSKDLVHWESGPRVFERAPAWTTTAVPGNRGYLWAPDVIRITNRYLLYYSVSTWGKRTSAIGLATNQTLDPADPAYRWMDGGLVIQSTDRDDFNAIDPSVIQQPDGRLWLAFGSFWSGIKMVELDPATGRRLSPAGPLHALASHESIEAPCVWRHGDHYFLAVNWGQCCRGVDSTYNIRLGRSRQITGPYLDRNGVDLRHGGGSLWLDTHGAFIGPGHAGILAAEGREWLSCHFYDGTRQGAATLALFPLHYDRDGWPMVDIR